jgi:hypothetical protein
VMNPQEKRWWTRAIPSEPGRRASAASLTAMTATAPSKLALAYDHLGPDARAAVHRCGNTARSWGWLTRATGDGLNKALS